MKLMTEKGELPLPEDFSFEIESNNPLFSDEGTASVPATIPPDDDAFDLLSRPERPGRSHRHVRIVPAMLQHGLFQRRCNMLIDTCSHEEGMSVTLAFSESEMYSRIVARASLLTQPRDVMSEGTSGYALTCLSISRPSDST